LIVNVTPLALVNLIVPVEILAAPS
jgi:hypothetical protein